MAEPDLLFALRNNFCLGAYQAAINEASDLTGLSVNEAVERDFYVHRSYIELGSLELVISEISDDSPMGILAVRLLAQYLSDKSKKESILATLSDWLSDPVNSSNPMVCLIAGTIYVCEENYVEALKRCHMGLTLEMMALCVQVYLLMNRVDKAEQQVKSMSSIDDDATITQLATAWVNLAQGGAKVQDAFYIFQELGEKHNWTSLLHNGSANCNMKMGRYDEAERDLLDALNKDAKDANTISNLITCQLHLGKPVSRYISQLKMTNPEHSMIRMASAAEDAFDRAATAYS